MFRSETSTPGGNWWRCRPIDAIAMSGGTEGGAGETAIDVRATLQKVRVPSFVVGRDGVITWLNDAATEAFGDLQGSPFSRVIPPERADFVRHQLDKKLERTASV